MISKAQYFRDVPNADIGMPTEEPPASSEDRLDQGLELSDGASPDGQKPLDDHGIGDVDKERRDKREHDERDR